MIDTGVIAHEALSQREDDQTSHKESSGAVRIAKKSNIAKLGVETAVQQDVNQNRRSRRSCRSNRKRQATDHKEQCRNRLAASA